MQFPLGEIAHDTRHEVGRLADLKALSLLRFPAYNRPVNLPNRRG